MMTLVYFFLKIWNFNSTFCSKIKFLLKNWYFTQKSKFCSKNEIFLNNGNFPQKSKFNDKAEKYNLKIESHAFRAEIFKLFVFKIAHFLLENSNLVSKYSKTIFLITAVDIVTLVGTSAVLFGTFVNIRTRFSIAN